MYASRLALKRESKSLVHSQGSTVPLCTGISCLQNGDNSSQKKWLIFISQQCNTITGTVLLWTADYHWNLVYHLKQWECHTLCSFWLSHFPFPLPLHFLQFSLGATGHYWIWLDNELNNNEKLHFEMRKKSKRLGYWQSPPNYKPCPHFVNITLILNWWENSSFY